jgi:hypothetical protein
MRMTLFLLVAPAGTCLHQLQGDLMVTGQREVLEEAQTGWIANRGMMILHDLHQPTNTTPGSETERKLVRLHYLAKVVKMRYVYV